MTSRTGFDRHDLAPGVALHLYPTAKFKSVTVQLFLSTLLDEATTAKALLPSVLRRGCRRQTTMRKMSVFLESLYGTTLGIDVLKMGDRQVLVFRIETVSDRYVPGHKPVIREAFDFLHRLIAEPVTKGKGFPAGVVDLEKQNLKKYIEGIINDRAAYAHERCIQEMCRGEAYSRYEYGRIEDIPALDPEGLLSLHRGLLRRNPIDLYIMGDVRPAQILRQAEGLFGKGRDGTIPMPPTDVRPGKANDREILEELEVEQGKLVMGFRTALTLADDDIYPMILYSGVLGGFPHSKLFKNVREAEGMAYSIHSSLDWAKGILFIEAGIDPGKFRKAADLIRKQVADMEKGKISKEELESTRKSLVDRLLAVDDSPVRRIHTAFEMAAHGRDDSPEDTIRAITKITRDDLARVAARVKHELTYFLKGPEEKRKA